MKKSNTYYEELINCYFAGEATSVEMAELVDWIRKDTANKKQFEEFRKSWKAVHKAGIEKQINPDAEWISLEKRIEAKSRSRIKPLWKNATAYSIAASVIILLGLFFILRYFVFKEDTLKVIAESGITGVVLPDGSKVTLNCDAILEYSKAFEQRSVELSGEAFFNVAPDPKNPFIVSCDKLRIEVTGTSFNVNTSQKSNKIDIVLTEGEVVVYFREKPKSGVIMQPQDKVEVSLEKDKIIKKVNTDPNYLSWKTRYFIFDNTPLSEVIKKLEKVYGNEIVFNKQDIANCRLTATFDDQSLNSILKVLQATFDIKIIIKDDRIRIEGNGCK